LLQAVQQLRAQKVSGVPDWVVKKENKLKIEIAYLSGEIYYETKQGKDRDKKRLELLEMQLSEAEEKYPKYLEYIEKSYPDYYNMKYKQKVIRCQDLQQRMADDDLLINYVLVDSFLHILVIDDDKVAYHNVPVPNRLNALVPKYIRSLKGDKPDDFLKYSNILYTALVKPIESYIDGQNMIFMPDGVLNYIPFELLPTNALSQSLSKGKKDYSMYKKIPYLIKKGPIAYNYSSTLYLEAKEHDFSDVPEGFMGFAPDFSKVKSFELTKRHQQSKYQDLLLSPLENAAIEVEMIGKLTMGDSYLGFSAKESTFKREASKYGVLHFATHGILNHKYPLYSSLVMLSDGNDGDEDGLLHTYELYNMNINAELVALSACNTGVGTIQKGEGAMSVARGFAYAGCPNIAMTLWPVSDQATQILMENFYVNLMQGMPKAKALQKAKLKFIESGSGFICVPFFWSGLILVGTPDQLHSLQILSPGLSSYAWIGIAIASLMALIALFFFIKKRN
jgi:CHAT domain-containing protein